MLSDVQIVAILLLAAGAAVSQFPICLQVCDEAGQLEDSIGAQTAIIGAAVALVACVLSAFGGVYSELLLKKDGALHSIHLQNLLLYGWGVIFNSLALLVKDRERIASGGLLQGYSPIVLLLIANNASVSLPLAPKTTPLFTRTIPSHSRAYPVAGVSASPSRPCSNSPTTSCESLPTQPRCCSRWCSRRARPALPEHAR